MQAGSAPISAGELGHVVEEAFPETRTSRTDGLRRDPAHELPAVALLVSLLPRGLRGAKERLHHILLRDPFEVVRSREGVLLEVSAVVTGEGVGIRDEPRL